MGKCAPESPFSWIPLLLNPPSPGSTGKILYADVHTAQQTDSVNILLAKNQTTLINVTGGTTSRVQPLDVAINKTFKNRVRQAFEEHLHKNLQLYTEGKLTASDGRVLATKWVEDAWSGIKEEKGMIIRPFVRCGLSNKLDGSEDHMVNIRGIEGYVMPKPESEFHLESDSDSSESESESEYDEGSCDDASSSSSSD